MVSQKAELSLAEGPGAAFDPFDLEAARSAPPAPPVEHVVLGISVRRPNRNEFFRVHDDPAFTVDGTILTFEEELYWVPPTIRGYCEADSLQPVRIFTCVSRQGVVFLWPAKLPQETSNFGRSWHDSALLAAEEAKSHWIKLQGNRNAGRYEMVRAVADLGEPDFGEYDLKRLLGLGFGADYAITGPDHAVLKKMRGEL